MKILEDWIKKLNPKQKIIFSIIIPIGLFILFYPIADNFDGRRFSSYPFEFEETWKVWLIYTAVVAYLEYKLFD
jgi:hypothetical protein